MVERYTGRGAFTTWPVEMIADYVEGGTRFLENGQVQLTCAPAWEAATFESAGGRMSAYVAKVKCPATILYAEAESTMRGSMGDMMRQLQPGWKIEMVPGTTHFLPMEKPDIVRAEILSMAKKT
jgi:pimeloyl-ACP methyl ester carboxylesterase